MALFLMNGANLECLIPEPKQYRENYSDRRWNIYPVMVGLQVGYAQTIVAQHTQAKCNFKYEARAAILVEPRLLLMNDLLFRNVTRSTL